MKINLLVLFPILYCSVLSAQESHTSSFLTDSSDTKPLREAVVRAYEQNRKLTDVGAPISLVSKASLNRFGNSSIVPALNTNPGVRMEERSPGSYRLNIRGSSLRSPFGVRDIKIYYNEIPLTDPGGNTYLNELGFYNFQSLEIIKGTAGSLYGAGIGGAVLINSMPSVWQKGLGVDYQGGSYNTNGVDLNLRLGEDDAHRNIFSYSHQTSDGYRQQTRMRRDVASWETLLKTNDRQTLHAYILYSDLYYQTPGALTLAEYNKDPRMARPAAGTSPSAIQAKAAIFQKNFTAGFSNEYHFSEHWQNTTAVYGAYTDFINPGIRVYELRQEPHFGGRTVFQYQTELGATHLQVNAGAEAQKGFFETRDFANKLGIQDTLQTDDRLNNWQYLAFAQADLKFPGGWTLTGGASFNVTAVQITRVSVLPPVTHTISFDNKIAPRIALLKKIFPEISLYASASRGFSTPTVQELEKTNGIVGPPLQPEDGIDYEVGTRGSLLHGKLFFDIDAFFFHLKNTIVQRIDTNGIGYSINAGGTDQHGLETFVSYQLADNPHGSFSNVRIWISHTWHDFHYRNFTQDTSNFSGNRLPSVPPQTVVAGLDAVLGIGLYTNITYTYADRIALNDANTAYAGSYNLLGGRAGYRKILKGGLKLDVFGGVDNAFNTKYSLGNDFNAAAGRYYNGAPGVNYYAGVSINYAFK
ncbi:MAG TPA: TonB-dependent receptor [Puia sp.]|jgi:iron complex outermembrane receptor protein